MAATAQRDGRQARWERHNRERRRHVLEAAVVVLESEPPGTEVHVQQIAERAGINRTVVYRHFTDRADLDRAVRAHILDGLAAELLPHITLDGTVREIIRRVVSTYVDWVVAHPSAAPVRRPGGGRPDAARHRADRHHPGAAARDGGRPARGPASTPTSAP